MHSGDEDDPSDMFLSSSIAWEGQGIPNSACRNSCVCEGGLDSSVMMEVGGRWSVGGKIWEDLGIGWGVLSFFFTFYVIRKR
jgi:hypothetical protein